MSDTHFLRKDQRAFAAYAYASARVAMRLGGPASPIVLAVVPDL